MAKVPSGILNWGAACLAVWASLGKIGVEDIMGTIGGLEQSTGICHEQTRLLEEAVLKWTKGE